ncbi:MAG: class I SAM-dependent methyltransferase [Sulfuritalea sp.]|nr:class I SAM-dependent methyltransferase [Sulfuritalea sp.]
MTPHRQTRPPLKHAAASQMLGAMLAGGLVWLLFPALVGQPLALAGIQGLCAALVSHLLRGPVWWLPIHLGFMPLAVLALGLGLPSWVWLAGFAVLLLVFWRTDRSRVPLYLTNAVASEAVAGLIPGEPVSVVDLGCGDGGLLRRLARARPDCRFVGFEHAPLTWAWAWLGCRGLPNIEIRFGDFWSHPLGGYALVYAFLSPVPMQRLWLKARAEMKPDALLVSNSFTVPDIEPESTVEVADARQTRLYCYRPAG